MSDRARVLLLRFHAGAPHTYYALVGVLVGVGGAAAVLGEGGSVAGAVIVLLATAVFGILLARWNLHRRDSA